MLEQPPSRLGFSVLDLVMPEIGKVKPLSVCGIDPECAR